MATRLTQAATGSIALSPLRKALSDNRDQHWHADNEQSCNCLPDATRHRGHRGRTGGAGHRCEHRRRCRRRDSLDTWTGAIAFPDYQGSQDYTAAPLWNIRAQNLYHPDTYAQLLGPIFTSNLIPDFGFRLGPMAQYIRKRGSVDNSKVDNLQNVDPSFMLGAILGYDFKFGGTRKLAIDFLGRQDVANDNGFLGTLQATYHMPFAESWRLPWGLETTWASSDYMRPTSRSTVAMRAAAASTSTIPTVASRMSAQTPRSPI